MIERLVEFSLKNRLIIFVFGLLLMVVGWHAMTRLSIDAVPDITNVQVQVLTQAPALGPLEVEQFITYPVEASMAGLPDIMEIRSISRYGISAVTVVFKEQVNLFFARQLVQQRLTEAKERIPAGFGSPEMGPATTGLGEVFQFTVEGENHTPMELRTVLDWEIAPRLMSVPGVVEVNTWGGLAKQFEVRVDPKRLLAHRLSLQEVFEAVEKNNLVVGSAYLEKYQEQHLIRGEGLVRGVEDLEDIVVAVREKGVPICIKDLGMVKEGAIPRRGAATRDGKGEVVSATVQMLVGENSRTVTDSVSKRIEEIQKTLPKGVRIVPFYNRTDLVRRTIRTVAVNLFEGGLLVIAVLFILLGNLRAGLLVASAMPLSMLFAFIGMTSTKISGNLMSLGAIDFGLIVDGSIVMVENIIRKLTLTRSENKMETIRQAALEVARPIFFSVGIIIVVYLPILTLQGTEGRMFKPMAYTVVFALVGSLLIAFTFMPAVCSILFRKGAVEKESRTFHRLKEQYHRALLWALAHPKFTLSGTFLGLVPGLALFPFLGGEFIPSLEEGDMVLQAWRLPSISIQESVRSTLRIEKVLSQFPEVKTIVSRTGSPEIATDVMGIELSDIFVILKPKKEWTSAQTKEELVEKMASMLEEEVPGAGVGFTQPIEMRFNELISGVRSDVAIKIFGPDLQVLQDVGDKITRALSAIDGARDVRMEQVAGLPVLRVMLDRRKMARYGMNAERALSVVESIEAGRGVGTLFEGIKRFPIVVKFQFTAPPKISEIENLTVPAQDGRPIPLGQIAEVRLEEGPAQISREFAQRRLVVECNVRGRDIESFIREAQKRLDKEVRLPSGYYLEWGGTFQQLERAKKRLYVVVPLTLFLVFILLYSDFGSMRSALLVYTGIPLAAVGGILFLFLRGIPFSISAGIGFIALFGVAVLNGIVMVSHINKLRREGKRMHEAVVEGALIRFRTVLMTTLVAILGFIPMALSHAPGAEVQRPLATVVIGGLISATLLTLFVLPTLYTLIEKEHIDIK